MKKDIMIVVLLLVFAGAVSYLIKVYTGGIGPMVIKHIEPSPALVVATMTPPIEATTTMVVKVALLGAQMEGADKKDFRGCDLMVLTEREVPYSTSPLNSAMKELFSKKDIWMEEELAPGNFIASQKDLFFDVAIIEGNVAKIYLTGKIAPSAGVCDDPRLKIQLEETALQFSTVQSVKVYLNGVENSLVFSEKGV